MLIWIRLYLKFPLHILTVLARLTIFCVSFVTPKVYLCICFMPNGGACALCADSIFPTFTHSYFCPAPIFIVFGCACFGKLSDDLLCNDWKILWLCQQLRKINVFQVNQSKTVSIFHVITLYFRNLILSRKL